MQIRAITLSRKTVESYLDNQLHLRFMGILESMDRGVAPETRLDGPGTDVLGGFWDELFRETARMALMSLGHGFLPAYTDDTVELLVRDGGGRIENARPFMYTDVRLANGLYRIYKDSFEFGDGAVRLLEPAGRDSVVTGLDENELAGFLLAFDALVPAVRERLEAWRLEVSHAAERALAANKADRIAQISADELLDKHVGPLGVGWECTVSRGTVGLVLYGPEDDEYLELPVGEFPAFLRDREALSDVLKRVGIPA